MKTIVTQSNFQECYSRAKQGLSVLYIPTAYRLTVINSKCIKKYEKANVELIKIDGTGFRMQTGKQSVFLFPGQLIEVIQ